MVAFRGRIGDFELANAIYTGASVTFYTVDTAGEKTSTLATLYASPTGGTLVTNPQTLDSEGKLASPIYIDVPVIAEVVGNTVGSHDTGVIAPRGTFKGDFTTGTRYSSGDVIRDPASKGLYAVADEMIASAAIATDIAAGKLVAVVDVIEIGANASVLAASVIGQIFNFDDPTAMADPGSGKFRLNNAAPASVTAIAVSDNSNATGNPDVSAYLLTFDDSTSATTKGSLIFKDPSAPEKFAIFEVTGLTDNSGWVQFAVTYKAHNSTFTDGNDIVMEFYRAGDQGTGAVNSFNGRVGAVSPIQADYDGFFLTPTEGDAVYLQLSGGQLTGALNFKNYISVATASTVDLGAQTGNLINLTGTTTVTSFGTAAAGTIRKCISAGSFDITHNQTSMILLGGNDITTQAGDLFEMISEGSGNWRMTQYSVADEKPSWEWTANVFTSSNASWPPPAGTSEMIIEGWGGGGAGAGGGGGSGQGAGGGAGGYFLKVYSGEMDSTLNITIGAGGAGAANLGTGGNGGATSVVGTNLGTLTANGGTGPAAKTSGGRDGGAGGTATGGDINITGQAGAFSLSNNYYVAAGGDAPRGGAGGQSTWGVSGDVPGGGGGGAVASGASSTTAAGMVIIYTR